ncbi:MAG: hypothetical protein IK066_05335 [Kiritimatiellae bacterium]|nr:hypothetical protein [Kiritimatiellia bacterium]
MDGTGREIKGKMGVEEKLSRVKRFRLVPDPVLQLRENHDFTGVSHAFFIA